MLRNKGTGLEVSTMITGEPPSKAGAGIQCRKWVGPSERCWCVGQRRLADADWGEKQEGGGGQPWAFPSDPHPCCLSATQGSLWQQSNETCHRALNCFWLEYWQFRCLKKKQRWRKKFKSQVVTVLQSEQCFQSLMSQSSRSGWTALPHIKKKRQKRKNKQLLLAQHYWRLDGGKGGKLGKI